MRRILIILMCCALLLPAVYSQSDFQIRTEPFGRRSTSGSPMGVCDMNRDFLNDIIYLDKANELHIAYQLPQGGFEDTYIGPTNSKEQWSLVIGDIDRNGYRDIVVGGAFDFIWIFYQNSLGFDRRRIAIPDFYPQGMNLVDIDNDGWLDLFMCNDVGPNVVWWNDEGILEKDTTALFSVLNKEDSEGNYSSEWADIDLDGDLDLYVSKCFGNAMSPQDPRRINQLFVNEGNGVFSEQALARGVASGEQSWTGQWYDADNDGDFDLLVSNHNTIAQFFENDGNGFFTDRSVATGLRIGGPVIQCLARDFDLDGNRDIVVGGFPHYFYKGRSGLTYQRQVGNMGTYNLTSLTVGDINRDAHPDVFGNIGNLINLPSSMSDVLLIHPKADNHYLKIYLQGVESNPDGVGCRIEVHTASGKQVAHVQAGEGYGIHTSFEQIFGLGSEQNIIDSVRVHWPSGLIQRSTNVGVDQYLVFWEGKDVFGQKELGLEERVDACTGDTIMLHCLGSLECRWLHDEQGPSIRVQNTGWYQPLLIDVARDTLMLPGTWVEFDRKPAGKIHLLSGDTSGCVQPSTIEVQLSDCRDRYVWEDGSTGVLRVDASSNIRAFVEGPCGMEYLDEIDFRFTETPVWLEVQTDSIKKGETAELVAIPDHGIPHWYSDFATSDEIGKGDTFLVDDIVSDTSFFVRALVQSPARPFETIGEMMDTSRGTYLEEERNPGTRFLVDRELILDSVEVYARIGGLRRIELVNQGGQVIDSVEIDLEEGWNRIGLGFLCAASDGISVLRTNDEVNRRVLGARSPQLLSLKEPPAYPYAIEGAVQVLESTDGYDTYAHFWAYQFRIPPDSCWSEVVEVAVEFNPSTASDEPKDGQELQVWPNPSLDGRVFLSFQGVGLSDIQIFDLFGKKVTEEVSRTRTHRGVQLHFRRPGLFWVEVDGLSRKIWVVP